MKKKRNPMAQANWKLNKPKVIPNKKKPIAKKLRQQPIDFKR